VGRECRFKIPLLPGNGDWERKLQQALNFAFRKRQPVGKTQPKILKTCLQFALFQRRKIDVRAFEGVKFGGETKVS
jgi:hypothetical protein